MEQIVNLIIPFIALAVISVMIDKLTLFIEGIMTKIPNLPDQFEWRMAYAVVLIFSTIICWQGDFRFFDYLNLFFPTWLDYLMTGLVISGGSAFVRTQFSMIDAIPASVMGVTASFKRMLPGQRKHTVEDVVVDNSAPIESYFPAGNYSTPVEEYPSEEIIEEVEIDYNDPNRFSDNI